MRTKYSEQLKELHDRLEQMGAACERAISMSIKTLTESRSELHDRVLSEEKDIDMLERDIEMLCNHIITRQQPIGRDLRRITAALRMIADMERIGDQAVDIAEISLTAPVQWVMNGTMLHTMATDVIGMVTDSVEAFQKENILLAKDVIERDDKVDTEFDRIRAELINVIAVNNGKTVAEECVDMLLAAKYLERIADHAVNIAEWVMYGA